MVELLNPLEISSSPRRTSAVAAARVCKEDEGEGVGEGK
jgi:hypothetical protein